MKIKLYITISILLFTFFVDCLYTQEILDIGDYVLIDRNGSTKLKNGDTIPVLRNLGIGEVEIGRIIILGTKGNYYIAKVQDSKNSFDRIKPGDYLEKVKNHLHSLNNGSDNIQTEPILVSEQIEAKDKAETIIEHNIPSDDPVDEPENQKNLNPLVITEFQYPNTYYEKLEKIKYYISIGTVIDMISANNITNKYRPFLEGLPVTYIVGYIDNCPCLIVSVGDFSERREAEENLMRLSNKIAPDAYIFKRKFVRYLR